MINLIDTKALESHDATHRLEVGQDELEQWWLRYVCGEGENTTEYLAVGVSSERKDDLLGDRIPLRDVLVAPESGVAYHVIHRWDVDGANKKASVISVPKMYIESTFSLPEEGVYLNAD